MVKINNALLSVSDKTGLIELAEYLSQTGVGLISTGGTARALTEAGLKVTEVADYTGSPELLDGRVKTLHPKVHAGLLYRRDLPAHVAQMAQQGWSAIDMVVVNLYPFERVTAKPGTSFEEAIENIDIGGPCMIRAAAKNHAHVAVLCDPGDYSTIIEELKKNSGEIRPDTLRRLAWKAFSRTSAYDEAISRYLEVRLPD